MISEMVAEHAGATKDKVLASDLFLYSRVPGSIWGAGNEFISSGNWMMSTVTGRTTIPHTCLPTWNGTLMS